MKKMLTILGAITLTSMPIGAVVSSNEVKKEISMLNSKYQEEYLLNALNTTKESNNMLFNKEMYTLDSTQHEAILKIIAQTTVIDSNNNPVTNFLLLKEKLSNLSFLSDEAIKMICAKQIDIDTIKLFLNTTLTPTTADLRTTDISPYFGYERKWNVKGYRYFTRWSWYTYITGFWNLEADPELSELIESAAGGGVGVIADILAILAPVIAIPVIGVIVAGITGTSLGLIAAVWIAVDKGNGVYGDFEFTITMKTVASTQNWGNF